MKAVFVVPSEISSGEAVTALHMAEAIAARGGRVRFLASPFAAACFRPRFPGRVTLLTNDREENRRRWTRLLRGRPDAVVFADYPLLFFSSGTPPLADASWAAGLDRLDAALLTLDHLGYAQRPRLLFFGPPHLSLHFERTPPLPPRMEVLLPCPVQAPAAVPGRRGEPFRYWELPLAVGEAERRRVRSRYLDDDRELLVFHSAPTWARLHAERFGLPYYALLPRILEHYLAGAPRRVTVVSVNGDAPPAASAGRGVRVVGVGRLPKDEYEALLLSADLMLTENAVSVTLGKAVCGLVPCAHLRNSWGLGELSARAEEPLRALVQESERARPGSVFPFEAFPIWRREDVEELGVFEGNGLAGCVPGVELFGGEATRAALHALLHDPAEREAVRARQRAYVDTLRALPGAYEAVRGRCGRGAGRRAAASARREP
ncbi:MAG: DUF6365 family protein [Longimicrobiaceae bacterium]